MERFAKQTARIHETEFQFMMQCLHCKRHQFTEEAQADENSSLWSFDYIKALSVAVRYSNPKLHAGLVSQASLREVVKLKTVNKRFLRTAVTKRE